MGDEQHRCDIVIPVYNSLALVKWCLRSVIEHTQEIDHRVYVVDDASDTATRNYLNEIAQSYRHIYVHRHDRNLGFVQSCNHGIGLGSAPYVLLLNSDVIVTPRWLSRLLRCAGTDARIAAVNPLTNRAATIGIPLAPGMNFYAADELLRRQRAGLCFDVVTGVGFCLLLKRQALGRVGVFDEIYGHGYCEESDLCMRLTTNGYRTVVAEDVYLYHRGGGSFCDRGERYRRNRRIFDRRWQTEHRRQYRAFSRRQALRPARQLFSLPRRWDPRPALWTTARELLAQSRERRYIALAKTAARGAFRLSRAFQPVTDTARLAACARPGRLRVTYVVQKLLVAGGILSIIQLVNELVLLGVEARIVALYQDPAVADWLPLLTCPVIYRSERELLTHFPPSDIAVATLHQTAPWVTELVARGRARTAAYFIQDYEPWFFSDQQQAARARVVAGYRAIPHRIVKSDWLQGKLAEDNLDSKKIVLGMNLGTFYPRDCQDSGLAAAPPTVIAMARPQTPRRGFTTTIDALARIKQALPATRIILFGDRFLRTYRIPFEYRDAGIVSDQRRLAELYSQADVFLDGSDFQGFGRCALEAMACGTACVVTGVGGVTEYAEDGVNCLVVPPRQATAMADSALRLLQNSEPRRRLVEAGLRTVRRYCHEREARETLSYLQTLE